MKKAVLRALFLASLGWLASSGTAQSVLADKADEDNSNTPAVGSPTAFPLAGTAASSVGRAGQRQTVAQPEIGIAPTARLNNRIQNRIQSRLRTRIDSDYASQSATATPFDVANDQVRNANRPPRR